MKKYYNILTGKEKQFAVENHLPTKETTIKVIDGKKFATNNLSNKYGDGTFGFATRIKYDLSPISDRRTSICRKRKNKCYLISNEAIRISTIDPVKKNQKEKQWKKLKRHENRNHKARRGCKKSSIS